jgi:protease-4
MERRGLYTIIAVFFGLFIVFFGITFIALSASGGLGEDGEAVGVVEITGAIMESKTAVKQLRKFSRDENIRAIVVRVDSPGGAVAPSQEIYDAVKKAKKEKPLVVSMGSTAASGGYYIACGADTIYANSGTVTGSIGVITQLFNVSKLVDAAQVDVETFTTGDFKNSGSPFTPVTEQDRQFFQQLIDDIYEQFVEDVAECRGLEPAAVRKVADGRVFTGRQAHGLELVDEIGTFQDAVAFVAKEAKIEGDPRLVYPTKEDTSLLTSLLSGSVQGLLREAKTSSTPVVEYRFTGF